MQESNDREHNPQPSHAGGPRPSGQSRDQQRLAKVVAGVSLTQALGGAAVAVLAIVGLSGVASQQLAAVAATVLGASLVAHGGALVARTPAPRSKGPPYGWDTRIELSGGALAAALGLFVLFGVATGVILPLAVIVLGATLLLCSGATADFASLGVPGTRDRLANAARHLSKSASGVQMLAGGAAAILGTIALRGRAPIVLSLVALLVLGAVVAASSAVVSARMTAVMRR